MNPSPPSLFSSPGYIPLEDYLNDIELMRQRGPWKLPLGISDRFHVFLLMLMARFSWFRRALYIEHTQPVSPSYTLLLSYLKRKEVYDLLIERNLHYRGYYSFFLQKSLPTRNGKTYVMYGQGVGRDKATALSIAIGEMVERAVSGSLDRTTDILMASPEKLMASHHIVYPPKYHRFLEVQKKRYKELHQDIQREISWVKGRNLITGETTYIPRQMTSWFEENRVKRQVLQHATTNGAAGYFTKEGAVLRGLLEAVQRDGFLVHWLTMTTPEVIRNETLPDHLRESVRDFERFGLSIHLLNTTSLSIPSIIVVATNPHSDVPQVVVCGGSAVTYEKAIENALKEMGIGAEMLYATHTFSELENIDQVVEPYTSNLDKMARQLYWRGEERMREFEWFISGEKVTYTEMCAKDLPVGEDAQNLATCLEVLKGYGEAYYPVVYYPKNPIQKVIGFYVAQVFIPKAFPLYLFEGYGTFESDRLQEFAQSKNRAVWQLNPHPHMFP